jgi:hypothetical protein
VPVCEEHDRYRFPTDFTRGIPKNLGRAGQPCAVWGASSKGVVFSILRARAGHPVDLVADINPAKQGKCLPVTGLKVHSPGQFVKILPNKNPVYVMNPNHLDEIKSLSGNKFTYITSD